MRKDTLARGISMSVKIHVAERDSQNTEGWPCCLWCGQPAPSDSPYAFSCAHFIRRSQGGLGCEENILTLCPACHARFDGNSKADARERTRMAKHLRDYLKSKYPEWDESKLIYRKDEIYE